MTNISKPLSLGFIGGSLKSAVGYTHFVASQMDHAWTLKAGCFSRDWEENIRTAQRYGVNENRTYRTWIDMLNAEQGRLDAIAILTPTPTHFELVCACLEAGYAVICEKALATSSREVEEIIKVRDKVNGFVVVTYNYSGYPMVRELRQKIKSGDLGKILHFQAEMPQEGFIRLDSQGQKPVPQTWRLIDGSIPTIFLDLAVHLHQLVDYLISAKPTAVVASQNSYGWFPEIIDNVYCLCRYTENIQGQFWFSKSALGHRNGLRLRIYGSQASAEWYQANPEELVLSYIDGRREIMDRAAKTCLAHEVRYNRFKPGHPSGFIEAFSNLYRDIAFTLNQDPCDKEVMHISLAKESIKFLEAISKSHKSVSWTNIQQS